MHGTDAQIHQRFARAAAGKRRRAFYGLAAIAFLGLAAGALPAAAQTASRVQARATLDMNNDGVLDAQELRASRAATFERADADGDGFLTARELENARMSGDVDRRSRGVGPLLRMRNRNAETIAERLDRLDTDGDGRVSESEFVSAPHPLLRFDADGDGAVTREEIERGRSGLRAGLR